MKRTIYLTALLSVIVGHHSVAQVVSSEASLELVADGFRFTEGPAADPYGNVFFTDQPNNRIWRYGTNGNLAIFMEPAGRANGLYLDKQGRLLACADEHNQLWRIGMNRHVEKLVVSYRDSLFNGPNDVWASPSGVIYFTDPYYQRDYWERTMPDLAAEALYMYKNGQVTRLDGRFDRPNGIIGTPDGKFLYVADIGASKIYRYTLRKDGIVGNRQLFANQGSDGMTIDERGNIYLTGKGIDVYDPDGNKIQHIDIPTNWTANVCFSGPNYDVLFITASDKVFTLQMAVKGAR
ncbi:SMP-30/gluconolactonase/LRE family protein [Parapedobacter sp. 10938]|uniref:SMP-30/gluconolactonase/LRE family protein n=1 Tax=Parapedobacter flavus TaxID=3110225 RepID=UPI002DB8AF8D|nr:SMP-30/gluconolactonase/LRE family protein [Parapedobacter sp. 10938]MEC3879656.1 SMP-30/gluconolactonase/LRE family protein [Parapedobacter sp. 10938]